ncbi:Cytochrome P450 [Mycena venus]|uniref:Cytochrome P450 n=1 Tax=Mycena venus TaxID=2733690 RepID=A0A8H6XC31_9AGAR|nr:Cytochrome P450 [Mycena venus]
MSTSNSTMFILLASVFCHLIFKKYEPTNLLLLAILLVLLPGTVSLFSVDKHKSTFMSFSLSCLQYYASLLLFIIAYCVSPIHPLSGYPGPLPAKIFKLWLAYVAYQGKLHVYAKCLHDDYGPIVHIGEQ